MDQETMKQRWDAILAKLQQERDELALKMHLGAKDAAAEWEKLEAKWHELKSTKLPPAQDAAKETAHRVADELKQGYEKIRKLF